MTTITQQLADALRALLPYAENEIIEIHELADDGDEHAQEEREAASAAREVASQALAAYDAQQAWSEQDADAAASEGWIVSRTSDGFDEIQKADDADVFTEDAQAIAHVYWMAGTGSDLHKRAIAHTLRDGNAWTYTQASIAEFPKNSEHAARIVQCVNALAGNNGAPMTSETRVQTCDRLLGMADQFLEDWRVSASEDGREDADLDEREREWEANRGYILACVNALQGMTLAEIESFGAPGELGRCAQLWAGEGG
jgi:hypothetical protein